MHKFFENWLRCRVQVMDAGRAERRGILINFFRKMSALSAQRHVLRSILGYSGPIFHDVGRFGRRRQALRLALVDPRRARIFAKNRRCRALAGRLALVGPVAMVCRGREARGERREARGERREGQLRIELCYCRGVTGRERRCQDAGKSAVTFLLGAAQFQNLR